MIRRFPREATVIAVVLLLPSCESPDPTGPSVPVSDGTSLCSAYVAQWEASAAEAVREGATAAVRAAARAEVEVMDLIIAEACSTS